MKTTSIIVDLRHIRCNNCKVPLHDVLALACPVCGARFDSVRSNHVGLAEKPHAIREAAGVRHERSIAQHDFETLDVL